MVERLVPKPDTGPSAATRERGHYSVETYTTTTTGARYVATIAQQGDGYQATSVLLGESALALALDRDRLCDRYAVLTPAAAMGDALLARLPSAGVRADNSVGAERAVGWRGGRHAEALYFPACRWISELLRSFCPGVLP
jgi:short subunit dehydrogenase-like uncharacterized protein